jgi:hypothetical protein
MVNFLYGLLLANLGVMAYHLYDNLHDRSIELEKKGKTVSTSNQTDFEQVGQKHNATNHSDRSRPKKHKKPKSDKLRKCQHPRQDCCQEE